MPRRKGFRSKAQWRFAFAAGKSWARRWAHETPGGKRIRYKRLPPRKHVRRRAR